MSTNDEKHNGSDLSDQKTTEQGGNVPAAAQSTTPAPAANDEKAAPAGNGTDEKKAGRFDKTFEEESKPVHASVPMDQIELKAEDLYDKDKVDLEQVEMGDVWQLLQ